MKHVSLHINVHSTGRSKNFRSPHDISSQEVQKICPGTFDPPTPTSATEALHGRRQRPRVQLGAAARLGGRRASRPLGTGWIGLVSTPAGHRKECKEEKQYLWEIGQKLKKH